jgi:hypothetical protein
VARERYREALKAGRYAALVSTPFSALQSVVLVPLNPRMDSLSGLLVGTAVIMGLVALSASLSWLLVVRQRELTILRAIATGMLAALIFHVLLLLPEATVVITQMASGARVVQSGSGFLVVVGASASLPVAILVGSAGALCYRRRLRRAAIR